MPAASKPSVEERLSGLLEDRDHLRGCPGGRVEVYAAVRPAVPAKAQPAKEVSVVRCIECGGSTVMEERFETVLRSVNIDPEES